jgi:serine/threonine protein kinase
MAELSPGVEFAGHRIEATAGRGGMGIVYRAVDLRLKRRVAMKVIAPELAQDAEFRERFERESQLAAGLDHTNVIPIHGAGEQDGVLFITMRYVEGTDLAALLAREGRLQPERAATIISGVAGALDAAHKGGLIHRDVKPANILIEQHEDHEHVYLTDFGLTKQVGASGPTRTGFAVGTFDYMAPEQFLAQPVDPRSDVYALGCVLFETITGRVPFPRPGDAARMYAHIQENPPPPSSVTPGLPSAFDDVVATALAKDPDERYGSAGEVAEAAFAALGQDRPSARARPSTSPGSALPSPPPAPPTAPPTPQPSAPTPPPATGAGETQVAPAAPATPPPASPPPPTSPPPSPPPAASPPSPSPAPAPAPVSPPAPAPRAAGHAPRRPSMALLIGVPVALIAAVVLGIVVLGGGGGSDVSTATPDDTVSGFLQLASEDDFSGACELLTDTAVSTAEAAPGGGDCASGLQTLISADTDEEKAALRDASMQVIPAGTSATATIQLPELSATIGSVTHPVTIGLEESGGEWLINDIDNLCVIANVVC